MRIEFDPAKEAINQAKHGVSLAFGVKPFEDEAHIVLSSIRSVDGEDRFKVVGMVDGKLWTAVYTIRGRVTRFMSVRRTNDAERKVYNSA